MKKVAEEKGLAEKTAAERAALAKQEHADKATAEATVKAKPHADKRTEISSKLSNEKATTKTSTEEKDPQDTTSKISAFARKALADKTAAEAAAKAKVGNHPRPSS
eukprot:gnl/TRDRNA2_/TRDRNA2_142071_c1_seq1.p1 gnl/TRDRNA2_/TRDRNA2_142071_c1~~gnl/TRDRNA2_/TRDRNA2_142071_c1_seq1.p1  ORF type:complete len:106 (+),score=29.93 gnl/TRDRNA2_/TRDRNA2_142071_c1_seq1:288-605(+)